MASPTNIVGDPKPPRSSILISLHWRAPGLPAQHPAICSAIPARSCRFGKLDDNVALTDVQRHREIAAKNGLTVLALQDPLAQPAPRPIAPIPCRVASRRVFECSDHRSWPSPQDPWPDNGLCAVPGSWRDFAASGLISRRTRSTIIGFQTILERRACRGLPQPRESQVSPGAGIIKIEFYVGHYRNACPAEPIIPTQSRWRRSVFRTLPVALRGMTSMNSIALASSFWRSALHKTRPAHLHPAKNLLV